MRIVELTENNVDDYESGFDYALVKNIGREYHRGLVVEKEDSSGADAAVFWELKHLDEHDKDTISEILSLIASDPEECDALLTAYNKKNLSAATEISYFEFNELDDVRREAFDRDRYKVKNSESRDIVVSVEELSKLGLADKKPPKYIRSLSELTAREFKTGIMTSVLHGRYGLQDDLPFLPMAWFDQELSSCVITDGGVNGFLLVHNIKPGLYRVELLYALQPDANINLLNMIRHSIRAAIKLISPEDKIILRRNSKATSALVKKLFPDKKGETVFLGAKEYR